MESYQNRDLHTPVRDERVLGFSPVSTWGDTDTDAAPATSFLSTSEDRIMDRLNSLEVLVREQHLSTREHVAKGLRECIAYEKSLINRVCKDLQEVAAGVQILQLKHQADPALISGIVGLVNSSVLYLQATAPNVVTPLTGVPQGNPPTASNTE